MASERIHLLTRCLRLEAEIVALRAGLVRPRRRYVTADDRAQILALHQQCVGTKDIAERTTWGLSTVQKVIREGESGITVSPGLRRRGGS